MATRATISVKQGDKKGQLIKGAKQQEPPIDIPASIAEYGPSMALIHAFTFACDAHAGQKRKGTNIPYITHPIAVCSLVLEFGGSEEQAIVGLLHDVVEDCDPIYGDKIQEVFGSKVASMVGIMTDGVADSTGVKADWKTRKVRYIQKMQNAAPDVLLVVACDKLHNATSILRDLQANGLTVFVRFSASISQTMWYYNEMLKCVKTTPVSTQLSLTIIAIEKEIQNQLEAMK